MIQRPHFIVLDGLRGIAAIAVVIFHFMEWVFPDFKDNFIGHGFLAVDFFFCLSGFVMSYAYDEKIKKIGLKKFFISRLIRLHPLVCIGSILGIISMIWDPFNTETSRSFGELATVFVCSLLLIPYPILPEKFFNLFSLNAPAWSLFWEYVANIIYAIGIIKLSKRFLSLLFFLAALFLIYISYRDGNLAGGWSKDNWEVGGIRLAYSFFAGLLLHRNQMIIKNGGGLYLSCILLVIAFITPFFTSNWLFESFIVILYFPFIIALGAGTTVEGKTLSISITLGNISYPLYMTHYWAIWIFGYYLKSPIFDKQLLPFIVSLGLIALIFFAHLVSHYVDEPIRDYLRKKYLN
ncbi:acyltransferase family protein [Sphingobacterium sp. LRF_L2]|uniref:acyltransferase family protein n=1 Tax=Sphingobacterium sp. LRF_L2 TaxID=3369421 RepID=UPI003F63E5DA